MTENIQYQLITCERCGDTGQCTPSHDYFLTPLWTPLPYNNGPGAGRVCEPCFKYLAFYGRGKR